MQEETPGHDDDPAATAEPRRFVVCGDNPLAYRLVHELVNQYDAHVTVIVTSVRSNWAPKIATLHDIEVVESNRLDEQAFRRASLERAAALAIVEQDDGSNVDAALIAQEINPDVRIVIRLFNLRLGDRMCTLLNNCAVISAAAIAAPAFVAAALDERTTPPINIAGRSLVATPRERAGPGDIVCGLAITAGQDDPEMLPAPDDEPQPDLVLALSKPASRPRPARQRRPIHLLPILIGTRVRISLTALILLFVAGTAVLSWVNEKMSWAQAAYIALLSELGGADADPAASGLERITLVVLTLVSIALIPALTAAVVDGVVKARLRLEAGVLTEPIEDHLVVIGLGDVGTRVIRALNESGYDAVAIEKNPQARGVQIARDLGIPVIIGNASRPEVLNASSVRTCRALVVASTNDVTNLETALLARSEKPDLRVVMRLFDGEFADRVQRAFSIDVSRSVSYLAAPAFAAAMLGRQVIATIPVERHVLLVAELPVGAGSVLEHETVQSVSRTHEARLLAVRTGKQVVWRPAPDWPVKQSESLVVVANRAGLSRLLEETTPQPDGGDAARLLRPWDMPHARSAPSEGPAGHPPFGPAEKGSTAPA